MKYLKFTIPGFILFLVFLFSNRVFATSPAPIPSASTLSVISGGNEDLVTLGILNYGIFPYIPDNVREIIQGVLNENPYSIDSDDCVVRPLSASEKSDLDDQYIEYFYTQDGIQYSINDLYLVNYDNGYISGNFYVTSDGDLLFGDADASNTLVNLQLGGESFTLRDWEDIYQGITDQIENNDFYFSPDNLTVTPQTYFVFTGETSSGRPASAYYVYVANQYNPGSIMRVSNVNGQTAWYAMSPDLVVGKTTYGYNQNRLSVTSGSFKTGGITYPYRITFNFDGNATANNSYSAWLNGTNVNNRFFATNGRLYNSTTASNAQSVYMFQDVDVENDVIPVPIGDPLSLNDVEEALDNAIKAKPNPNLNFDYQSALNRNNYPVIYNISEPIIGVSSLPLPGISNSPAPLPAPDIDTEGGITVIPGDLGLDIPILSNLKNRFPFSIPFDIYNLVSGLSVARETPVFSFTYTIPIIDYDWDIDVDLTAWNGIAEIFRLCFLILFIISLAVFAYKHFFGS